MKLKYRILTGALILSLALGSTGCSTATGTEEAESADNYIPVEIQTVESKTLVEAAIFNGKIFSDHEVSVVPKVPGKVTSINVKVGDKVQAGQVLFSMDTSDLQATLDQATVGVQSAELTYELNKDNLESTKENLERYKVLYEAGAVSKVELENMEKSVAALEKQVEMYALQLENAKNGLAQAQKAIADMTVTAPVSGTVSAVNVVQGQMASQAMAAVTITKLDALYVALSVPENIVNSLKVGQEARVIVNSAGEKEFKGILTSVSPSANLQTTLYPVKVTIEDPEGLVKPGMFAKVEIPTQTKENVLAINSEAVVLKDGKTVVFVVEEEQAVPKEVKTGLDTGSDLEIVQGLQAGEQVIVKGQTLVEQGSKVKVVGGNES